MSSDEEELADDADATEARKKARQGDDDHAEEMSDEEVDLAKDLDKELGDDPEEIPDFDDGAWTPRSPSPLDEPDQDFEMDIDDENSNDKSENQKLINPKKG